jgi:xylulokinase
MGRYVLGFDIGSSSVKAALLDIETGTAAAIAFSPSSEMPMAAPQPGFAEQDPDMWWSELLNAVALLRKKINWYPGDVMAIGISYQMHVLVCVDKNMKPLRHLLSGVIVVLCHLAMQPQLLWEKILYWITISIPLVISLLQN